MWVWLWEGMHKGSDICAVNNKRFSRYLNQVVKAHRMKAIRNIGFGRAKKFCHRTQLRCLGCTAFSIWSRKINKWQAILWHLIVECQQCTVDWIIARSYFRQTIRTKKMVKVTTFVIWTWELKIVSIVIRIYLIKLCELLCFSLHFRDRWTKTRIIWFMQWTAQATRMWKLRSAEMVLPKIPERLTQTNTHRINFQGKTIRARYCSAN